jgi:hypothetical protein
MLSMNCFLELLVIFLGIFFFESLNKDCVLSLCYYICACSIFFLSSYWFYSSLSPQWILKK